MKLPAQVEVILSSICLALASVVYSTVCDDMCN